VPHPDVVMDRGFDLPAPPAEVFPWFVQLGKRRAGWYFPRHVERMIPPGRRGLRHLDPRWQTLRPGDVIPDYGGADETFTAELVDPPDRIVYSSTRGRAAVSWEISLSGTADGPETRAHLRLRAGPVRHRRLIGTVGDLFDLLTIAGLAAGLAERLEHD
jgi:hypothetical protein